MTPDPMMPDAAAPQPTPPTPWLHAAPPQVHAKTPAELVQTTILWLAMGFLAVALIVAYYSANSIVSIWFQGRFVPIVRFVLALVVAGIAAATLVRVTRRSP